MEERANLVRQSNVPVSGADEAKINATVAASLKALDEAVRGSLFDTEPQTFDVELRRLSEASR